MNLFSHLHRQSNSERVRRISSRIYVKFPTLEKVTLKNWIGKSVRERVLKVCDRLEMLRPSAGCRTDDFQNDNRFTDF